MVEEEVHKGEKIIPREIEEEMKQSYVDYAMSVIVGRALPDVRDGLKPVHRRILFAMNDMGMLHNKPFKKSARIVGEVLGKYHPHGDTAVYDSMVRMAQSWSLRYPIIDGQGNMGSVDGDSPAAMRYCITGDSLIQTDKGILPISSISDKKDTSINMKIQSYNGKINTASKFFNSGKHKTIKISTQSGYSIEGSYNHPILTWKLGEDFKPQISWKLLENIEKGDIAIINRTHNIFSEKPLDLQQYYPEKGFKNNITLPSEMNNDLAFLLGALVSEGSFHNKQLLFNNKDKKFYNKVKSIIKSQFKDIQIYERKIKGKCTELSIYEQKAVIFLNNIGLKQIRSHEKEIPFSILASTKENIKHFLIGLYEGDGSVQLAVDKRHSGKSVQLTYDSKSKKLISDLKTTLLNFGIISGKPYKDKRNHCFKLYLLGSDSVYKFYREIGFFSDRKNKTLKTIEKINQTRLSKTDFIPFLNDYLRNKYPSYILKHYNFDRYNSLNKNYSKLQKIINKEDLIFIEWILENKFYFDQITEIEKTSKPKEVFSVKVNSKCHSFVANGFINHNTEARLKKLSEEILQDIEKDTVKFVPNFDDSLKEPTVLPSKVPNLLINGSSGIAVGMATNIPPHNMNEVIDGTIALIDNPDLEVDELMKYIKGPDFPTGATICGISGIKHAYKTGRGKVIIRAKTEIQPEKNRIMITEIPYMVNKADMIKQMAVLVNDGKIRGISDIRDESDREGMSIVIELRKDANANVVLNQLYKHTRLQDTFGIITVALVNNEPKLLPLNHMIQYFIDHRKEIIKKRTDFDLKKAGARAHILEGLLIALKDIDSTVKLIKESNSVAEAKETLQTKLSITEKQSLAILDMKLQKLAGLEQEKIKTEHSGLIKLIEELKSILASEQKILDIIKTELSELKKNYGDERRSDIIGAEAETFEMEDLIKQEKMVITVTHSGYIKRQPLETYKQQKRGGRGIIAAGTKEQDFIEDIFVANTHSFILFFTDKGKVHWLKVYNISEGSRQSLGKSIVNLLHLEKDEKISAFVPVSKFKENEFLIMATKNGTVKKTSSMAYSNPRKGITLAKAIAADGEGAEHLVEVVVEGLDDVRATAAARAVCRSSLVKSAVHGRDANWGRVVGALGAAGVPHLDRLDLDFAGIAVLREGAPVAFDEDEATAALSAAEVQIRARLPGDGRGVAWGCDLSAEYVRINADYRS